MESAKKLIAQVESVWSLRLNGKSRVLVKEGELVKRGAPVVSQTVEKREIIAPVSGKVLQIANDRLEISFKAKRILGKSFLKGKKWGLLGVLDEEEKLVFFGKKEKGKVLLVEKITPFLVQKGLVLRVAGFLSFGVDFFTPTDKMLRLPVLIFERQQEKVKKELRKYLGKPVLIDSYHNQLLICFED